MLNLERNDAIFMAGSTALVVVLAFLGNMFGAPRSLEAALDLLVTVTILGSLYFVYKGSKVSGGELGRYMTLIIMGLTYYGITLLPHVYWHIVGQPAPGPLTVGLISGIQHSATVVSFLLPAYGFYLFWKGGKA